MAKYQFIPLDSILAKYHRDFRGLGINEGDAIEWIGEALGFAKIHGNSEEAVAYIEVKNYQCDIPNGLHYVIQIARNNQWTPENKEICNTNLIMESLQSEQNTCPVPVDCNGELVGDYEVAYYRPFFDLQYEYLGWANKTYSTRQYTPVKLSNNSFFNSVVCTVPGMESLYSSCQDEYTIVQDQLRFSFKEGFIALAYLRQITDECTGYPMIPDDESARAAITYYLAWKFKQREAYNHREGAAALSVDAENLWLKYIKQFKAKTKMPSTIDDLETLKNESNYLIPRRRRYDNFFGKLGTAEQRPFNNPTDTLPTRFARGLYENGR